MQPENPCSLHQTKQVNFVCLSKDCTLERLFCDTCKGNHYTHHVVSYNQFEKIYDKFQDVVQRGGTKINKQFIKIKETFALCIKRTEEKVLKQIISCYPIPKLNQLQFQQRFGVINQILQNQNFLKSIDNPLQNEIKNQDKYISDLNIYLEELNTNIMASINKFMSQLKVAIDTHTNMIKKTNLLASIIDMPVEYFKFSQHYKPQNYILSQNRTCVTRNSLAGEGLSMYCITQQPFSKQNNTIIFTITQQTQRFIYFGVCEREVFKLHNFKGNLYQKGRKMYSIRQSAKEGANAVCLHNSRDEFSNKDQVPWDFKMGDVITLKYIEEKNTLQYIKNGGNLFEMPLDKETNKFYPFVGLKHQDDSVKILSAKKKGFFSSIFE